MAFGDPEEPSRAEIIRHVGYIRGSQTCGGKEIKGSSGGDSVSKEIVAPMDMPPRGGRKHYVPMRVSGISITQSGVLSPS